VRNRLLIFYNDIILWEIPLNVLQLISFLYGISNSRIGSGLKISFIDSIPVTLRPVASIAANVFYCLVASDCLVPKYLWFYILIGTNLEASEKQRTKTGEKQ